MLGSWGEHLHTAAFVLFLPSISICSDSASNLPSYQYPEDCLPFSYNTLVLRYIFNSSQRKLSCSQKLLIATGGSQVWTPLQHLFLICILSPARKLFGCTSHYYFKLLWLLSQDTQYSQAGFPVIIPSFWSLLTFISFHHFSWIIAQFIKTDLYILI